MFPRLSRTWTARRIPGTIPRQVRTGHRIVICRQRAEQTWALECEHDGAAREAEDKWPDLVDALLVDVDAVDSEENLRRGRREPRDGGITQ